MKKIFLILQREYLSRVRKKSFIVMTIIGPLLMASMMIVPVYIAQMTDETKNIEVIDESGLFFSKFTSNENVKFEFANVSLTEAKAKFFDQKYDAILYIPKEIVMSSNTSKLFSDNRISLNIKIYLQNIIKKEIESLKLETSGVDKNILNSVRSDVEISTFVLKKSGMEEQSNSEISTALGVFGGVLIYFFIFMFGAQVMRGVIEEKISRIVEVIVSSVKPFQLMMGKIIGVALVGLTQFSLWVILTFGIVTIVKTSYPDMFKNQETFQMYKGDSKMLSVDELKAMAENEKTIKKDNISQVNEMIKSIDFVVMISSFIFYFLGGYLLYAAFFAAIGAAVDNEADTQQFMLPITIPLLLCIVMLQYILNNPHGPWAFWLSIIPLTSPIVMMIRIPFGVPYYEVFLSMGLLIIGFFSATWFAAKIYRTGILMYGKKINYKELWKWLRYKG